MINYSETWCNYALGGSFKGGKDLGQLVVNVHNGAFELEFLLGDKAQQGKSVRGEALYMAMFEEIGDGVVMWDGYVSKV